MKDLDATLCPPFGRDPPPTCTNVLDLPRDALTLVTRLLPRAAWPAWRATCTTTRDAVRAATTALRIDVSRDGPLPLPPPPPAAVAGLRVASCVAFRARDDDTGPHLAPRDALAQLAGWLAATAPRAAVALYVRCERAALDFAVVLRLADAGLLGGRAVTLSIRADGARGLTLARDRCERVSPALAVAAEIKTAAPFCRVVGAVAGWPLTRLTVLAAAPGAAVGPLGWAALSSAAATLASLDACAGVPLDAALARDGRVVWAALTDLTLRGDGAAEFLGAWPPHAAPVLARPSPLRELRVCRRCDGTATVPCTACGGLGRLPASGYAGRNTVSVAKVVGTSWTALAPTLGRTHFHAAATRVLPRGGGTLVRLVATCDPGTALWVPPAVLRCRAEWAAGSLPRAALAERRAGGAGAGGSCRTCGGGGGRPCPLCSAAGEVVDFDG